MHIANLMAVTNNSFKKNQEGANSVLPRKKKEIC